EGAGGGGGIVAPLSALIRRPRRGEGAGAGAGSSSEYHLAGKDSPLKKALSASFPSKEQEYQKRIP
ncbi:hypothetical protein, partial [Hydrogenibacillus schlegelii]|uniref:hypothetical protein n=1 Tax=Hydrogenibacillus schlegelii TaxID=1484 RepID=UPI0039EBDF2C